MDGRLDHAPIAPSSGRFPTTRSGIATHLPRRGQQGHGPAPLIARMNAAARPDPALRRDRTRRSWSRMAQFEAAMTSNATTGSTGSAAGVAGRSRQGCGRSSKGAWRPFRRYWTAHAPVPVSAAPSSLLIAQTAGAPGAIYARPCRWL